MGVSWSGYSGETDAGLAGVLPPVGPEAALSCESANGRWISLLHSLAESLFGGGL